MTSAQVSQEATDVGVDFWHEHSGDMLLDDFVRGLYLAMKAAEPLPQGDVERAANNIEDMVEGGSRNYTNIARAALVRSKPIDREIERLGEALFNLSDKMRASGILSESDAVHEAYERVVAEFTAIGSQSIEGERGLERYYANTCPCQAAERYIDDCPKHGSRAKDEERHG